MERLLSADPFTGIRQVFHYDHDRDESVVESVADAAPTLRDVETARQSVTGNWRGDMHLVAKIPPLIAEDLFRRGILQEEKALAKWLCDRDNLKLRVKEGRV